jgi:hypothetical protein
MERHVLRPAAQSKPMRRFVIMVSLVLAVTAVPAIVSAEETTASHAVGASCGGVPPACPSHDFTVTTDGVLRAETTVSDTCVNAVVRFSLDGTLAFTSDPILAGETTGLVDLGPVSPGTHTLTVTADVPLGINCDSRLWTGTLSVTTAGVTDDDIALVAPGEMATVSTAVTGSPRPAGVTATLTRTSSATTTARLSAITYDGLPSGLPPSPIRAAGYLDLQLTNGDLGDSIAGEFLPPNPILPPNPVLPPNPIVPPNPILPPSPIRLAYWVGDAWSPVLDSFGNTPTYSSAANLFTITFNATSTPAVTALGGTVFATIPSYYFRGFGTPVDAGALNIAKAGRAIPLKWQVFDYTTAPVLDLDSAVVRISSVAIPCEGSGDPTDVIEEYAAGGSGLQNLGDGVYQLNWETSRSYSGTCRRVRLDLGERNPDGSIFYRTADFQFKK